jgi:hypothetical protein
MRLCNLPRVSERVLPKDIDHKREHLLRVLATKWVNGTLLRYCFLDQPAEYAGSDEQKKVVRDGFNVWMKLGIGIKFEEVSNPGDAQVRIGFLQDGQTWSAVGREILQVGPNERTMNFGWSLLEDPRGVDVPTHEIGHTLGFPHEHQNPTAGIVWNEDAVYDWATKTQGWTKEDTDRNIISKIVPDEIEGSSWDANSIMHYAFMAGLINEPEQYRNGLTPAGGLSERDITWVRTFYPPLDPTTYSDLTLNTPVPLSLGYGEQRDFTFVPDETRTHDIATSGESDTVMVLFEEKNGKRIQLAANDDSAEDFNSHISWGLTKGNRYVISIRLYHEWAEGGTTVKVW